MRSIMISIQSKWAELIFIGSKTREIRKTLPNDGEPFKVYVYVTLQHPLWIRLGMPNDILSGKVVGEFVCKAFDRFFWNERSDFVNDIRKKAQLSFDEMKRYAGSSDTLFGWHIDDVNEYDKPFEIGDFLNSKGNIMTRAPQSWQYVKPRHLWMRMCGGTLNSANE